MNSYKKIKNKLFNYIKIKINKIPNLYNKMISLITNLVKIT